MGREKTIYNGRDMGREKQSDRKKYGGKMKYDEDRET